LVNAIACQQLSVTVGITLLNRLTERYGLGSGSEDRAFPRPDDLSEVEVHALRALGYSRSKGQAIIDAARAMREGTLDPDRFATMDDTETINRLMALRGVGRWTAEYTRCCVAWDGSTSFRAMMSEPRRVSNAGCG